MTFSNIFKLFIFYCVLITPLHIEGKNWQTLTIDFDNSENSYTIDYPDDWTYRQNDSLRNFISPDKHSQISIEILTDKKIIKKYFSSYEGLTKYADKFLLDGKKENPHFKINSMSEAIELGKNSLYVLYEFSDSKTFKKKAKIKNKGYLLRIGPIGVVLVYAAESNFFEENLSIVQSMALSLNQPALAPKSIPLESNVASIASTPESGISAKAVSSGIGRSTFSGKGLFIWKNKDKYNGELKNGKPHGEGVLTKANGDVYKGIFKKGKLDGENCLLVKGRGDRYQGEFKKGKLYQGIFQNISGDIYQGKFKNGKLQGKSCILSKANGDLYQGEFRNNKLLFGVYRKANGNIYQGKFKNGKLNGENCILRTKKGKVSIGKFKRGRYKAS